jgi:hypothetical protein
MRVTFGQSARRLPSTWRRTPWSPRHRLSYRARNGESHRVVDQLRSSRQGAAHAAVVGSPARHLPRSAENVQRQRSPLLTGSDASKQLDGALVCVRPSHLDVVARALKVPCTFRANGCAAVARPRGRLPWMGACEAAHDRCEPRRLRSCQIGARIPICRQDAFTSELASVRRSLPSAQSQHVAL